MPLRGVRVVELGGGVACAFAGRWLAALGAQVIQIPRARSARGALHDLLATADVVIDGTAWSTENAESSGSGRARRSPHRPRDTVRRRRPLRGDALHAVHARRAVRAHVAGRRRGSAAARAVGRSGGAAHGAARVRGGARRALGGTRHFARGGRARGERGARRPPHGTLFAGADRPAAPARARAVAAVRDRRRLGGPLVHGARPGARGGSDGRAGDRRRAAVHGPQRARRGDPRAAARGVVSRADLRRGRGDRPRAERAAGRGAHGQRGGVVAAARAPGVLHARGGWGAAARPALAQRRARLADGARAASRSERERATSRDAPARAAHAEILAAASARRSARARSRPGLGGALRRHAARRPGRRRDQDRIAEPLGSEPLRGGARTRPREGLVEHRRLLTRSTTATSARSRSRSRTRAGARCSRGWCAAPTS